MPSIIKINIQFETNGQPDPDPKDPITIEIPDTFAGDQVQADFRDEYNNFYHLAARCFGSALYRYYVQRNGAPLPEVLRVFMNNANTPGTVEHQAINAPIATDIADAKVAAARNTLVNACRDYALALAGTQLGDWNDG
ncbi:MAG: hypothetical protein AAF297_04270 [Planctomycetota bacterium]